MRTSKFRAWDKERKLMCNVTNINFYDKYIFVEETPMTGWRLALETTPLMQWTGLIDKNGTLIFEGDVIAWMDDELREAYCVAEISIDGLRKIEEAFYYNGGVIGNIYKNPTLLQ